MKVLKYQRPHLYEFELLLMEVVFQKFFLREVKMTEVQKRKKPLWFSHWKEVGNKRTVKIFAHYIFLSLSNFLFIVDSSWRFLNQFICHASPVVFNLKWAMTFITIESNSRYLVKIWITFIALRSIHTLYQLSHFCFVGF